MNKQGYSNIYFAVIGKTLDRLLPVVTKLAEDEWEDDHVKSELENFRNEIRANLQHIAKGE